MGLGECCHLGAKTPNWFGFLVHRSHLQGALKMYWQVPGVRWGVVHLSPTLLVPTPPLTPTSTLGAEPVADSTEARVARWLCSPLVSSTTDDDPWLNWMDPEGEDELGFEGGDGGDGGDGCDGGDGGDGCDGRLGESPN